MRISSQQVFLLALYLFAVCALAADNVTASASTTATAHPDPTMTALLKAGSLAWTVLCLLGIGLFRVIALVLWPVLAIAGVVWRTFVVGPWVLLTTIAHVLYPVVLFFLAAVLCGTVIGGCAGFAAEAVSWLLITATWGRTPPSKSSLMVIDPYYDDDDDDDSHTDISFQEDDHVYTDDDAAIGHHRAWDRKGKQPMRQQQQHQQPTPYRYASPPPPGLLVDNEEEEEEVVEECEDEWAWEEEEDLDAFPRRRRWRASIV